MMPANAGTAALNRLDNVKIETAYSCGRGHSGSRLFLPERAGVGWESISRWWGRVVSQQLCWSGEKLPFLQASCRWLLAAESSF